MMQKQTVTATKPTNTTTSENDLILVGGIWENRSAKGTPYFKLTINEGKTLTSLDKIVIFTNNNRKGEKSPDLFVFVKNPI